MDKQEMDPHVKSGLYGTPEINPDEQHRYLGNFRERIYALQTRQTAGDGLYMLAWEKQLSAHPDAVLYLNGQMDREILDKYIKLAAKQRTKFTLKSDTVYANSDVVVVLAAKTAVHKEVVDIVQLVGNMGKPENKQSVTKTPWYKKLF